VKYLFDQVFQRRVDDTLSFEKNWNDYANGFGDLLGNFWLGWFIAIAFLIHTTMTLILVSFCCNRLKHSYMTPFNTLITTKSVMA